MTDIPEDEWRYSINYGPEGEANYAFVYDGGGHLVSNLKIHHAIAVVEQMNARAAQAERMARLEEVLRPFAEFAPVAKAYCRFKPFLPFEMQVQKFPTEDDAEAFDLKGCLTLEHFDEAARALSQEGS